MATIAHRDAATFGQQILCDDGGDLRRDRVRGFCRHLLAAACPTGRSSAHRCCICMGLLFSLWTLFFLSQALLVANGRLRNHKAWGLAGISLATAMLFTGLAVAIQGLNSRLEAGYGDAARAFTIVPVSGGVAVRRFVTAAIAQPAPAGMAQAIDARRHHGLAASRRSRVSSSSPRPAAGRACGRACGPPQPVEFTMAGWHSSSTC